MNAKEIVEIVDKMMADALEMEPRDCGDGYWRGVAYMIYSAVMELGKEEK